MLTKPPVPPASASDVTQFYTVPPVPDVLGEGNDPCMVHGQQYPTESHRNTLRGGCALKVQGAEGAAWRRMAGHVPAETLSYLLLLPYFAAAMLLVTAATTLFAQLSWRSRQDRSRAGALAAIEDCSKGHFRLSRDTLPLQKMRVRTPTTSCSVKFKSWARC